jgi:hypothetical protein
MTAYAAALIWWIVGTFGVAGLVAFWFLAPTAAQLTLQAVVKFFHLVLSYRVGCALLAAIVAGLIVDHKRHAYDDEQFAKRTALFEEAQRRRDDTIAKDTREKVWIEIGNATAANKIVDNSVKGFSDALPPPPKTGNPFLVGADADKLCNIAGKTQCGPSGDQGMPKARRPGGRPGDHAKIRLPSLIRTGIGADQQSQ